MLGKNKKRVAISLNETKAEQLEQLAEEKGISKSAMISVMIDEFMRIQKGVNLVRR